MFVLIASTRYNPSSLSLPSGLGYEVCFFLYFHQFNCNKTHLFLMLEVRLCDLQSNESDKLFYNLKTKTRFLLKQVSFF